MALRLRRGTDSERQLITPLEGELIYTTDTKILFIGDGVTQGGLQVTGAFPESIDDLTDVDISSVSPTVGQVLTWNGEEFLPADTIGNSEQINADIIADDSTLLVDSETQAFQGISFVGQNFIGGTFTGSFTGDGSQLTNLPITTDGSGIVEGSNYRINIAADDSTIIVDTNTQTFTGNFVGDGSGLTNLNLNTNSIFDLSNVFTFTTPDPNDILTFDGFNFVPQKIQFIEGADSTVMVDTATNTFTGNFAGEVNGNVTGDISGSVFSDDSQLLVDGVRGEIVGTITGNIDTEIPIYVFTDYTNSDGLSFFSANGTRENPSEGADFDHKGIKWETYDDNLNDYRENALILGSHRTGGGGYLAFTAANAANDMFNVAIEMDGVAETTLFTGKNIIVSNTNVPTSSIGNTGDVQGMIAVDSTSIYYCIADHDGVSNIWVKQDWSTTGAW